MLRVIHSIANVTLCHYFYQCIVNGFLYYCSGHHLYIVRVYGACVTHFIVVTIMAQYGVLFPIEK